MPQNRMSKSRTFEFGNFERTSGEKASPLIKIAIVSREIDFYARSPIYRALYLSA
ncbi:unnamed protein product [Tenebrio molitor]|nr:unnamed protein product [Tenebrio molitor]